MIRIPRSSAAVFVVFTAHFAASQQLHHNVDPRNMYERVLVVLPKIGAGTHADPLRAAYAPMPAQMNPASRSGILAYQCMDSDDGKLALCEFIAADRSAFKQILSNSSVKAFVKGKDRIEDVVAEFKKHKKDFDINMFGVRVP